MLGLRSGSESRPAAPQSVAAQVFGPGAAQVRQTLGDAHGRLQQSVQSALRKQSDDMRVKKALITLMKKSATEAVVSHLDVVLRHMSMDKSASVRQIQALILRKTPLVDAVKTAYPHLTLVDPEHQRRALGAGDQPWRAEELPSMHGNSGRSKGKETDRIQIGN